MTWNTQNMKPAPDTWRGISVWNARISFAMRTRFSRTSCAPKVFAPRKAETMMPGSA
jgi:hypothetical protein